MKNDFFTFLDLCQIISAGGAGFPRSGYYRASSIWSPHQARLISMTSGTDSYVSGDMLIRHLYTFGSFLHNV